MQYFLHLTISKHLEDIYSASQRPFFFFLRGFGLLATGAEVNGRPKKRMGEGRGSSFLPPNNGTKGE